MEDQIVNKSDFEFECEVLLEETIGQLAYIADEYNVVKTILVKEFARRLYEHFGVKEARNENQSIN